METIKYHRYAMGKSPRGSLTNEPNKIIEAPEELKLPEGWTYEEVPRTNPKYEGKVDKYYYEPETRAKFRTFQSVLRYLAAKKAQQKAEEKQNQRTLACGMSFKSLLDAKRAARKAQ